MYNKQSWAAMCLSDALNLTLRFSQWRPNTNTWSEANHLWFISYIHLIGILFGGGNQALTVGPVLWLSCLQSSAGDLLTLRGAETKSWTGLKVSIEFKVSSWRKRSIRAKRNKGQTCTTEDRNNDDILSVWNNSLSVFWEVCPTLWFANFKFFTLQV